MKTKEELNDYREEVEAMNNNLAELSEVELGQVAGGAAPDALRLKGEIIEVLPNQQYTILLENGTTIKGHISGTLRLNYIRVIDGDKVTVEMSRDNTAPGRIISLNM